MQQAQSTTFLNKTQKAIQNRSGYSVRGSTAAERAIVISEMFRNAQDTISIVSDDLNPSCFGDPAVIANARAFLALEQATVEILLYQRPDVAAEGAIFSNPFVLPMIEHLGLIDRKPPKLQILGIPPQLRDREHNFVVLDRKTGFCFQPDSTKDNFVAAFEPENFEVGARNLYEEFNMLQGISLAIYSPPQSAGKTKVIQATRQPQVADPKSSLPGHTAG